MTIYYTDEIFFNNKWYSSSYNPYCILLQPSPPPYPFPERLKELKHLAGQTPQPLAVTRSFFLCKSPLASPHLLSQIHHFHHRSRIRVFRKILNHRSYSSDELTSWRADSVMWHIIDINVMWWKNRVYGWFLYLFYYFPILRYKLFDDTSFRQNN